MTREYIEQCLYKPKIIPLSLLPETYIDINSSIYLAGSFFAIIFHALE